MYRALFLNLLFPGLLFFSLLLAVPLTTTAQAPTGVPFQPTENMRLIPPDAATPKRIILPGDIVIPQIANGELAGGQVFFTIFEAMSLVGTEADFQILFFDGNGDPMSLPFAGGSGQKGAAIGLAGTLQPRGGGAQITIAPGAPVQIGYASVQSTPQDSVAVTAIFNNQVPGERLFQASIPQDSALHDRMAVPYLNAGGLVTSFALVAAIAQTVDVVARAPDGSELCRTTQSMASGQHIALLTPTALPCTVGGEGFLDFIGQDIGLSAVGFTAADQGLGAFTTFTPWGVLSP
jgi:hypothetical protein